LNINIKLQQACNYQNFENNYTYLLLQGHRLIEKNLCTDCKIILYSHHIKSTMYSKFVDFYNIYLQGHSGNHLQLDDNLKLFYTVSARILKLSINQIAIKTSGESM